MTAGETQQLNARIYWRVGVSTVAAHLIVAFLRTRDAWFFADDFQNLMVATSAHKPPGQFLETVFGQYVPMYRATNYVLFHVFGLNFAPMLAFLLACSATAVGMLMWLCARVRLWLPATIAIGAFLACTWIPFEGQSWWSAGLHLMPGAATLCACITLAARPSANLGRRHSLVLAVVFGAGIAYYNSVLLVFGPLVAIRWYIRLREQPDTSLKARLIGVTADLAPSAIIAGLAIVALVWLGGDRSSSQDPLSVLLAAGNGIIYGMGAAIAGGRGFSETGGAGDLVLLCLIGTVLLVAVVATSIIRARQTAWLWAGCFAFVIVQLWLIGNERISTFGPWVVASARYNLSNVLMFTGTAIVAFSPCYPAKRLLPDGRPRLVAAASGGIIALALVIANITTGLSLALPANMQAGRDLVGRLQASSIGHAITVGNRILPETLTPHWTGGYAALANFVTISLVDLHMTSWNDATHFVADDGTITPIASQPMERWTWPDGRTLAIHVLPQIDSTGELSTMERWSAGTTISGWANPLMQRNVAMQVMAVLPDATARYAGSINKSSPDLYQRYRAPEFRLAGFSLELTRDIDISTVRFFLVLGEKIAIPLPFAPTFTERLSPSSLAATPVPVTSVALSEAFSEGGWFEQSPEPPLPGHGYGSFATLGDTGQGEMKLTLNAPNGPAALLVPVLTGPTSTGMRITISDPATGAALATLANPPAQVGWRLWTVTLPGSFPGGSIEARIEDRSSDWGAWLAIGPIYARPAN